MTVSVLIIDDDAARTEETVSALAPFDFATDSISQASAGIGAFLSGKFDVVCLPETGFGGKGRQLAKALRGCTGGADVALVLWGGGEHKDEDDVANETWSTDLATSEIPARLAALAHRITGGVCNNIAIEGVLPMHRLRADVETDDFDDLEVLDIEDLADSIATGQAFPDKVPPEGELGEILTVRNLLLHYGRIRATGVLALTDAEGCISIAMSRGFVVGASDTSLQDPIGARLVRKKIVTADDIEKGMEHATKNKVRLAEALLQMGILDAHTLLQELEIQAKARASRAAGVEEGNYAFDTSIEAVERLSITPMDITEILLDWFLRESDRSMIQGWLADQLGSSRRFPVEHPAGLNTFRRLRPASILTTELADSDGTLGDMLTYIQDGAAGDDRLQSKAQQELYACARAGVFYVDDDAGFSSAGLPLLIQAKQEAAVVDKTLAVLVQSTWLKSQGKNFFEVVGAEPDASQDALQECFDSFCESIQVPNLTSTNLGPVNSLGASLRGLCAEMEFVLLDPDARKEYVAQLGLSDDKDASSEEPFAQKEKTSGFSKAEVMAGLDQAEQAMAAGDHDKARVLLEKLGGKEAAFVSVRANVFATEADASFAIIEDYIEELKTLHFEAPRNVRVLYLLGKTLLRVGETGEAMSYLSQAAQLVPDDPQVKQAIEDAVTKIVAANDLV